MSEEPRTGPGPGGNSEGVPTLAATGGERRSSSYLQPGVALGRYIVLEHLGSGGMGVVYLAYDPELERRLAVKLLHQAGRSDDDSEGRRRITREAQAMARLEHPNTITVHDVGEHEGKVYVAMEFVEGLTLRDWLAEPRRWRSTLDTLAQAGSGLAAAHAEGLVHRDFKPDNVMVGNDGRVRVMDFGLARPTALHPDDPIDAPAADRVLSEDTTELTQLGAIVGTPAYMAPEQHLGEEVGPAADQFAFCVALWEALYGERPFPGETPVALAFNVTQGNLLNSPSRDAPSWLRPILTRGLSSTPEARFATMDELLRRLERGQARRQRRLIFATAGTLVAALAAGVAVQRVEQRTFETRCEEQASLQGTWDEARADSIRQALLGAAIPGGEASATRAIHWLDTWAADYEDAAQHACLTWSGDSETEETWGLAEDCLFERRLVFGALADELEDADATAVRRAVAGAANLPSPQHCADERRLAVYTPLPPDKAEQAREIVTLISQVDAKRLAGRFEQAIEVADAAVTRAETLDHAPLLARAKFSLGTALARAAEDQEAKRHLEEAFEIAGTSAAPEVSLLACRELTSLTGHRLGRPEVGLAWNRIGNAIARDHGLDAPTDDIARATNLAGVYFRLGDLQAGVDLYREILPGAEAELGSDHPTIGRALINYANLVQALGELDEAAKLYRRAIELNVAAFGPDHPSVATATMNLGTTEQLLGNYDEASKHYHRSIEIRATAFGEDSPTLISSLVNLAAMEQDRDRLEPAAASLERALELSRNGLGETNPRTADCLEALADVRIDLDELDVAEDLYKQALVIREELAGEDDHSIGFALSGLAKVAIARGEPTSGRFAAERAVAVLEKPGGRTDYLARAYFTLAQTLWAEGTGPAQTRALELARKGRKAFHETGELKREQRVTQWLEARDTAD